MKILKNKNGETIFILKKDGRILIHHTDATEGFVYLEDFLLDIIISLDELVLICNALKELKLQEIESVLN